MMAADEESNSIHSNGSMNGDEAAQNMNMDQGESKLSQQLDEANAGEDSDAPSQQNSSAASSTSTQWPSAPPSPSSSTHEVDHLQNILDRALHDPFSTHPDQAAHLKANTDKFCREAAQKIYDADVLLVVTGAGFSADSGLATYVDVADIEAYRSRGWTYRGLCTPPCFGDFGKLAISNGSDGEGKSTHQRCAADECESKTLTNKEEQGSAKSVNNIKDNAMEIDEPEESKNEYNSADEHEKNLAHHRELYYSEHLDHIDENSNNSLPDEDDIEHPQYFYGFWGQCCNDYRRVKPHDGYDIVARWGRHKNSALKVSTSENGDSNHSNETNTPSSVAQEIRGITHFLEQGGDDSSDSDDSSASFMKFKEDNEDEPYYVSPTKRAGAFFVFTSNVDAHSFDVFESHEIRECHGNVELWQCNNFSCGTNATAAGVPCDGGSLDGGLDAESENDCNETGKPPEGKKWQRRLWRLPLDFQFTVDKTTMKAPHSKLHQPQPTERNNAIPEDVKESENKRSGSPPAYKRRKSSMNDEINRGGDSAIKCTANNMPESGPNAGLNNADDPLDTATGLGGLMEETLCNHLERGISESHREEDDLVNSQHAHVGDVHGKPRLFPLRHMNPPLATPADSELCPTKAKEDNYYLPIAAHENWPRCPRCKEAARPAVLMFNDLDWVYNLKQEQRWQRWCQSLLKVCKRRRSPESNADHHESDSTVSDTNMSEKGWNDVSSEPSTTQHQKLSVTEPETKALEQTVDGKAVVKGSPQEDKIPGATKEASDGVAQKEGEASQELVPKDTADNSVSSSQSFEKKRPTSNPLKVAILEVGCGYNVPTCRVITERLVGELLLRGGDPTLIRINPSHPEPDDQSVEESVISIMEKGLMALKKIDGYYCELTSEGTMGARKVL